MSNYIKTIIIIILLSCIFTLNIEAEENSDISINELVTDASNFDNKTIIISGEVIGEVIERGDYCWININDGTNAMGIWIENKKIEDLSNFGDYSHRGDVIEVSGVFYSGCGEHGGEVDIHGENIIVVEKGYEIIEKVSIYKILTTIFIVILTFVVAIIYIKKFRNKEY